jgi:hypothetical protein
MNWGNQNPRFEDDPGEAPIPAPLGETEWIETLRERERTEEKSAITATEFWRVILGGLHSEVVDRFDEEGFKGLSAND